MLEARGEVPQERRLLDDPEPANCLAPLAKVIDDLAAGRHVAVQRALVREAMPFYKLWVEIEKTFTSGDGYLDKLCMELVGLDSSRCRPPTRGC